MNPNIILNPESIVRFDKIGHEEIPVVVVDNWAENAEQLKACVPQDFSDWTPPTTLYPGLWASPPPNCQQAIMTTISPLLESYFNIPQQEPEHVFSCYAMMTTPASKLSAYQTVPHFDSLQGPQLAVLHYLCSEACLGTAFYRHRETGYETLDEEKWPAYQKVLEQGFAASDASATSYIRNKHPSFTQIKEYPVVFNRMLIYPGDALHTGLVPVDFQPPKNVKTGRLTLTSFISFY